MKPKLLISIGSLSLLVIIVILAVVVRQIAMRPSLSLTGQDRSDQVLISKNERKQLRKITIEDDSGCLEVTPDGVVRMYADCDGTLTSISRPIDPKRIIQLYEYTSRVNTADYRQPPTQGEYIRMIIETSGGSQVVFIPVVSGPESISDTIDLIKGDIPKPSPTPLATLMPTPTLPGQTPLPTQTATPTQPAIITPTVAISTTPRPFTCGFADDPTDKRPYNVTNVICSTQPSPAP